MIFYMYDDLGWTTTQFGILVDIYGLLTAAGQAVSGPISDRVARKPVSIAGLILNSVFYLGLVFVTNFYWLLVVTALSGLDEALLMPALSAYYLDISAEQYCSRIMDFKGSSAALGGITVPLLVTGLSGLLSSTGIFMIAFLLLLSTAGVATIFLRVPLRYQRDRDKLLERASIVP
jgi:MFS family permease